MRWAGHVVCVGEIGMHLCFWWKAHNQRDHYEDLHVPERMILKLIVEK
jgi:hypothetical protein